MRRRVVITGMGAVSPLGTGVEALWSGLYEGRSGVALHERLASQPGLASRLAALVEDFDASFVPRTFRRFMSRMSLFATSACRQALDAAGLDPSTCGERLGLALGSTTGSVDTIEDFFTHYLPERDISRAKTTLFFRIMGHSCAANAAQFLGVTGRVLGPSAACSTSLQALILGFEAVAFGRQEIMVCGGADEFHPLTAATFEILQAASLSTDPAAAPAPFDARRDGIVCAEGGGALVLESLESARARGAPVLAEIAGCALSNDPGSMSSPQSEAIARCMAAALDDACVSPEEIGYVNAHATGTTAGDAAEAKAVAALFPHGPPVSSLKGHLGHTMAASGALELIACVSMLTRGRLLPTKNLDTIDPECAAANLLTRPEPRKVALAVKNNFALGGVNASLVLRKP